MGLVIRQSIISSTLSYLGVAIAYFNLLWLFPKVLLPDEIGLIRIIQDIAVVLVPFAQIGLSQSTIKFFPVLKEENQRSGGYLSFILISTFGTYCLFLIIFLLFINPISSFLHPSIVEFLHLVLIITFLLALIGVLESYCRSLLKIVAPNFIREVLLRLFTSVIVLLYFQGILNLTELLYAFVVIYFLALAALIGYLIYLKEFTITFDLSFLNKSNFKKFAQYSLYSLAGSSGILVLSKVDSIMISSILGLAEAGIYSIVFYVAVVIEMPKRAIVQITSPLISRAFETIDLREIKALYRKASINQLIIGTLLFIGIWASIHNLFYIMPNGEIYEAGRTVILIIGLSKLVDMTAGVNGEIIVMSKYYRFNILFITILMILTIFANYFLIPIYGIHGAAFASFLSLLIFNLIKLIFVWIKFKMQPFSWNTVKAIVIGGFVFYLTTFISFQYNAIVDTLVRSVFITILYSILILTLKVSPEANTLYKNIKGRFIGILKN
ncbi:hypothetical protein BH23BAC1_BH23BAC1_38770 [soil metagenome]